MASIGIDPNGRKRILFIARDGKRKTVRLGKVAQRQAEAFKLKVEKIIGAEITGDSRPFRLPVRNPLPNPFSLFSG
jgi:hypothetical protein